MCLDRVCIDEDLYCNGVFDCNGNDTSDEPHDCCLFVIINAHNCIAVEPNGGTEANCVMISANEGLANDQQCENPTAALCSLATACIHNPCLNGGTCLAGDDDHCNSGSYTCTCASGFEGDSCEHTSTGWFYCVLSSCIQCSHNFQ
jgi:hypothetical protein